MSSPCVFGGAYSCIFFLDWSTERTNTKQMSALLKKHNCLKQAIKAVTIIFKFKNEISGVHPFFERLIKEILEVSMFVKIIFSYVNGGTLSKCAWEFLQSIVELVCSGKTKVEMVELWEDNEDSSEEGSPVLDSFEANIVRMITDSRSSVSRLFVGGFLPNRKKLESKIAKLAMHHECRLMGLDLYHEESDNEDENDEDTAPDLVDEAVETREKRRAAVLVCCVLRACEGAPHFMDVMLQVAEFVGVLDHPQIRETFY